MSELDAQADSPLPTTLTPAMQDAMLRYHVSGGALGASIAHAIDPIAPLRDIYHGLTTTEPSETEQDATRGAALSGLLGFIGPMGAGKAGGLAMAALPAAKKLAKPLSEAAAETFRAALPKSLPPDHTETIISAIKDALGGDWDHASQMPKAGSNWEPLQPHIDKLLAAKPVSNEITEEGNWLNPSGLPLPKMTINDILDAKWNGDWNNKDPISAAAYLKYHEYLPEGLDVTKHYTAQHLQQLAQEKGWKVPVEPSSNAVGPSSLLSAHAQPWDEETNAAYSYLQQKHPDVGNLNKLINKMPPHELQDYATQYGWLGDVPKFGEGFQEESGEHSFIGSLVKQQKKGLPSLQDEDIDAKLAANPGMSLFDLVGVAPKEDKHIPVDTNTLPRGATWQLPEATRAAASEQGYNVLLHHGTRTPVIFDQFRLPDNEIGVHFGSPRAAQEIQGSTLDWFTAPRVYPTAIVAQNSVRMNDLGSWYPEKVARSLIKSGMPVDEVRAAQIKGLGVDYPTVQKSISPHDQSSPYDTDMTRNIRDYLQSKGYDSIVYKNKVEDKGHDSYILFRESPSSPGHTYGARLPWADFDPSKFTSANIKAGIPLAGATAAYAASQNGKLQEVKDVDHNPFPGEQM